MIKRKVGRPVGAFGKNNRIKDTITLLREDWDELDDIGPSRGKAVEKLLHHAKDRTYHIEGVRVKQMLLDAIDSAMTQVIPPVPTKGIKSVEFSSRTVQQGVGTVYILDGADHVDYHCINVGDRWHLVRTSTNEIELAIKPVIVLKIFKRRVAKYLLGENKPTGTDHLFHGDGWSFAIPNGTDHLKQFKTVVEKSPAGIW